MTMQRKLNILELYHDCGPGGAEQTIVNLCGWLQTQGHAVTVVTCRDGWLAQQLRDRDIETLVVPKRRLVDLKTLSTILRIARERRADVLHAHELPMMVGLAAAARVRGLPLVATIQGRENIAARRRRRLACRFAGHWCRKVVAVSEAMNRFLVEDLRLPKAKVQTIYNAIDVERYQPAADRSKLRQALGIPPSAHVIGTAGSLYPVKGQTHLLQALARVVRKFPDTVCLIAGRGELLSVLQHEAAALDLEHRVKFLGFRSDIPEVLSAMDIFILPSLSEGLPLALLEAQAAGKPGVATDVGGNPEVIEEGKTGYLVPPARPDLLAERIALLLHDPGRARAMGENARSRVRQVFGLETMGREYLSLYLRSANGHGPAAGAA